MATIDDIQQLSQKIKGRDITALGRAITLIESSKEEHQLQASKLIDSILPVTGNALRIGITGVPGVGKSTFIEAFGMYLIEQGKRVAVLAIDPSSSKSKGSILGDKTRMEQLSIHPDAFIRPTATGGSLGGVANKTKEAALLCEAAGFDIILIETVGVGQSETEVANISDFFLLLMLAGAGDELQGIKRGIMEMADGVVITKADGENKDKTVMARNEYARALHFLSTAASGWAPKVLTASSYQKEGIAEAWQMIEAYVNHTQQNGFFVEKRKEQNLSAFHHLLNEQLQRRFLNNKKIKDKIADFQQSILNGILSPYSAAAQVMENINP